jgi:DNA-binding transcriptional LysR family regulator
LRHSAPVLYNRLLARGKFRHVQVLLKVAELGSVQRAAEAIGITQSSVTQTLAYLESLLEVRLFERHARGMRPTPACGDLLPVARQILLGVSLGAEAVAARQQHGHSIVRIAASIAAVHGLLVDALPNLAASLPGINVHLSEAEGEDQLLAIARGEVDFVACRRPAVVPEGWTFVALVDDRFAVVCHPGHPFAGRSDVSGAELAAQTWMVAPVGVAGRERFEAFAASAFPHPPRTYPVITRSPVMTRWVVGNEDVLVYLPFTFIRPLIETGEMAEVEVHPHVAIEPLGLLRPLAGSSEASERVMGQLQERFGRGLPGEAAPARPEPRKRRRRARTQDTARPG